MNVDALIDLIFDQMRAELDIREQRIRQIVGSVAGSTGSATAAITALQIALQAETDARRQADQVLAGSLDTHADVVASPTVLGHVKIDGTTITIADGVISSTGGGSAVPPPPDTYAYVTYGGDYVTLNGAYVYLET